MMKSDIFRVTKKKKLFLETIKNSSLHNLTVGQKLLIYNCNGKQRWKSGMIFKVL